MEVTRIFDLLPYYEKKYKPKDDVIASKENGEWVKFSIRQYREMADSITYGFLALGIQPGDKIAQISPNRVEWNIVDMAILQAGAVHVPIYPTISESDYKYILNHAEVKYVFISGMELLRKIQHILPEVPFLLQILQQTEQIFVWEIASTLQTFLQARQLHGHGHLLALQLHHQRFKTLQVSVITQQELIKYR